MATLKFQLLDSNGTSAEIGDTIQVTYPRIERRDYYDDIAFYRPQCVAVARIGCSPSKGLYLKISRIMEVEYDDDELQEYFPLALKTGSITPFRRTVWQWELTNRP